MIKRLPKLRGRGVNSNKTIQVKPVPVNLTHLEAFKSGEMVTPVTLASKKVIETIQGRYPRVKILSLGEITVALTVRDCEVSAGAKTKIEKAGGKVA
jgi:ribosomal protein L15